MRGKKQQIKLKYIANTVHRSYHILHFSSFLHIPSQVRKRMGNILPSIRLVDTELWKSSCHQHPCEDLKGDGADSLTNFLNKHETTTVLDQNDFVTIQSFLRNYMEVTEMSTNSSRIKGDQLFYRRTRCDQKDKRLNFLWLGSVCHVTILPF